MLTLAMSDVILKTITIVAILQSRITNHFTVRQYLHLGLTNQIEKHSQLFSILIQSYWTTLDLAASVVLNYEKIRK